jgi:hypothetical protein
MAIHACKIVHAQSCIIGILTHVNAVYHGRKERNTVIHTPHSKLLLINSAKVDNGKV